MNQERDPNDRIAKFRAQFSSERRYVPLNNAGTALLPMVTRKTIESWAGRFYDEGVFAIPDAYREIETVRADLARLIGAETIAFFPNTAAAISQVAFGLNLRPGDEVIVWDQEYPSSHYPWQVAARRAGAKVIIAPSGPQLETPVETLTKLVTPQTRALAFSWVQFRSGAMTDLQAITTFARERGLFTCADVIQGVGVLPFHFGDSGLDAACGGSHKWLCAGPSVGYLALAPPHLKKLEPLLIGATTFGTSEDPVHPNAEPKVTAHRFEPGSQPLLDILALGASVRLIEDTGVVRIAQEAEWLARKTVQGLRERGYVVNSPHGPSHFRGAIVNFSPGANAKWKTLAEASESLRADRIGFATRPPGIRVSFHAYNTEEDLQRFLNRL